MKTPMHSTEKPPADDTITGPRTVADDRRRRGRLRDLCDEVIASFRLASDRDPISEQDRAAALLILPRLTSLARG
jgi:hypothetical protein